MDASPAPRPPAGHRGLLPWLAALAVALIVIVVVAITSLRHALDPRVPDLAALASSPQVTSQDKAASAALTRQFSQIGRAAPWLGRQAQGMTDSCQLYSSESQVVLSRASWSLQCARQETLYYVFDGTAASRLVGLQRVLAAQGWAAGNLKSADRSPVTAGPAGLANLPALPGKTSMKVAWSGRGQSLAAVTDFAVTGARPAATKFSRTLAYQPVSLPALARQAFPGHDSILAIMITVQYYDNPDVQSGG